MSQNQNKTSVLKLVEGAKKLANNEGLLNLLGQYPFLGNLILACLLVYGGKNLFETFLPPEPDPNLISKEDICNKWKGSNKAGFQELRQTGPHTDVSVEDLAKDSQDYFPFVCSYSASDLDIRVQVQALNDDLLPSSGEKPGDRSDEINEAALDDLCRRPDLYPEKVQKRVNRPSDTYTTTPQGVILNTDMRVWPVFRWKCVYEIELKDPASAPSDWAGKKREEIGLNLTPEYCHDEYDETRAAYYHDYNDPYSWYCTIPNRDAKKPAKTAQ